MKKIFIVLLLFGVLGACKKDEPIIKDQLSLLPTATQRGANTGGCLVDGEAFLPSNEAFSPLTCNYHDAQHFAFSIKNRLNGTSNIIRVRTSYTRLEVGKTYQLNKELDQDTNTGEYSINTQTPPSPEYYSTTPTVTGELTITAHNFDKAFLSGTFWFDAVNINGEVVEVREGRFDMQY